MYKRATGLRPLACPECTETFKPTDMRQFFCSTKCRRDYFNRDVKDAAPLMILMKAWRQGRHTKDPKMKAVAKEAFTLLCLAADEANAKDKAAGRTWALDMLRMRYQRHEIIVSSRPSPAARPPSPRPS